MIMITAAGGAVRDSLAKRLMNAATSAAGRWVDERKRSVRRKNRARYFKCMTCESSRPYSRV
jgi:hypothetical protein